jgi:PAS domain S-box-containing protein
MVEDSEDDALLMVRELRRNGYDLAYERVDTAEQLTTALTNSEWDVVLSDFSMPNFSAPDALKLVQDRGLDIPFIIVSGTVGEDAAVESMKRGAHDFFAKSKLARLVPAIEREIREAEERRKHRWLEAQLHQSEERFGKAFHASPIGITITTVQGIFLDVNEQFLELFGYSRDDVIGHSLLELGIRSDSDSRQRIERVLSEPDSIRDLEIQCQTQSGETRDVLLAFEAVELGSVPCLLILFHDITARKRAQDELNALYNATSYLFRADSLFHLGKQIVQAVTKEFGQIDCGLLLVDKQQNRMVRLARAGEQQIQTEAPLYLDGQGLVPEAVITEQLVYSPDVDADERYVQNDSRTRSELVVPLRTTKDIIGVLDLQSINLNAFSERDQRVLAAFAERAAAAIESMQLYEEINRRAAELEWRVAQRTAELQQAKDHVEAILHNSSDAIILLYPDGTIQQTNRAFTELFGYHSDQVFRQSVISYIEPEQSDMFKEILQTVVKEAQPVPVDLIAHRADGTIFNAEIAFASVRNYKGDTTNVICSVRDVTQRKQIEEGLRKSLEREKELNELKSRFVSMVSHEFRTPLAIIQSSADIMARYSERMSQDQKTEHLTKIKLQVQRLTGLLDEVLTLSKAQSVGLEFNPIPIELSAMCQNIVEDMQLTMSDHVIEFVNLNTCPEILADPKLISQAVTNLLSNAIIYSPTGRRVWLTVSCARHKVIIQTKDEGIGIPPEDQKHLFEIFHRASNVGSIPGTGLGLAIVKQAVEAHGGTIDVESKVGVGTTFTITFPFTRR